MKCSVVERAHRTIRDRPFRYFTHIYTYRYIDVLPNVNKAYNGTVHTTTGMAPCRLSVDDVLAVWRRMEAKRQRVRVATANFRVGQHVVISKGKMWFAKAAEHNFSPEIFRIVKVIHRLPRVLYELGDLNGTPIDCQFYSQELSPVRINIWTIYER